MPGIMEAIAAAVGQPGTGTDPNTGAVLRDRFHQIRGNEIATRDDTMLGKLSQEFLASRGAPITPQNLVIAQEYLRGGALGRLEQQQATEDDIASAAIAADGGAAAGGGGGGGGGVSAGVPPSAQPAAPVATPVDPALVTQEAANPPPIGDDAGGMPWILPALAAATGGGAAGAALARTAQRPQGVNGEIVNDVAVRPQAGPVVRNAADDAIEDAIIVGVNPADASRALPTPATQTAAPPSQADPMLEAQRLSTEAGRNPDAENAPHAAVGNADDADWGYRDSRPIATEDVMPQGREVGTGSYTDKDGKTVHYAIQRDDAGFRGVTEDGRAVTGKTLQAVRKALRGL